MRQCLCLLVLLVLSLGQAQAFDAVNAPGWEKGSDYNRLYDPAKYETLKGQLMGYFTVTPLPGMSQGLSLTMRLAREDKDVAVHLGPMSFVDFLPQVIEPGAQIKIKGSPATVGGQQVFMAAKIRKGEVFELKLRSTRTGTPYWDLSRAGRFEETLEQ